MDVIRLADYTTCPGVDYVHTGNYSGQWFATRIEHCLRGQPILLDIDGTAGVHPNFLEGIIDTLLEKRIDVDSIEIKSDEEPEWKEFWHEYLAYVRTKMEGVDFDNDIERHQFWNKYFFYKVGHHRKNLKQ